MSETCTKPKTVYANRMVRFADEHWLIWSNKWGCWYRPNSQGYTSDILQAGIYTRDEAADHYRPSEPRSWRTTEPFPLSEVKKTITALIEGHLERAAQGSAMLAALSSPTPPKDHHHE